jgi:hypothetical protein
MLIPNPRRTRAPVGRTPILRHSYSHDRVSAISANSISPLRQWIGLYFEFHRINVNRKGVVAFFLLRDGAKIHRAQAAQQDLQRCLRPHLHRVLAYAPELNPDEHVWTQAKRTPANDAPPTLADLEGQPDRILIRMSHSPNRLWSCIDASELSWR